MFGSSREDRLQSYASTFPRAISRAVSSTYSIAKCASYHRDFFAIVDAKPNA
jgi:hypothetical protein